MLPSILISCSNAVSAPLVSTCHNSKLWIYFMNQSNEVLSDDASYIPKFATLSIYFHFFNFPTMYLSVLL